MKHTESHIQRQCVQWFRYQYPNKVLFAIPNGGKRGVVEAGIMKSEGTLAGVADLFLMHPNKKHHGLFIEMKSENGRQSPAQLEFSINAIKAGYDYQICRSLDEFMKILNDYINAK